jgi:hypothetical protein
MQPKPRAEAFQSRVPKSRYCTFLLSSGIWIGFYSKHGEEACDLRPQ